ncbi:MAG: hypothetical protein GY746_05985 [Gammaproteobacteria bacterium]|nr:hypothetical protein [Gammaproteobacteria bacterium]
MPGKSAGIADLVLEVLGVALGYWGTSIVSEAISKKQIKKVLSESGNNTDNSSEPHIIVKPLISLGLGALTVVVAGDLVLSSAAVPYNVRELLSSDYPWLTLTVMAFALYWGMGAPVYFGRWIIAGRWTRVVISPLIIMVHAAVMYFLLRIAVPIESIHDIVGSPIMDWSWEWELLIRFAVLFSVVSLVLGCVAAIWIALASVYAVNNVVAIRWIILLSILFPLAHLVVVVQAATDNLTELMLHHGSWVSSLLLTTWLMILAATASLLSSCFAKYHRLLIPGIMLAVLSIIPAYLAISLGTNPTISKYGSTFSALQFLLSPDRSHLIQGAELFYRYVIAHTAVISTIALTQYPLWKFMAQQRQLLRQQQKK